MTSIIDIIKQAVALIASLFSTNQGLKQKITEQAAEIAALKAADITTAGTTEQLTAAKAAAEAHDAASSAHATELQSELDDLTNQSEALASAITSHPDIPIQVTPLLSVLDTPTSPPQAPPVDTNVKSPSSDTTYDGNESASKDSAPSQPDSVEAPPAGLPVPGTTAETPEVATSPVVESAPVIVDTSTPDTAPPATPVDAQPAAE